MKRNNKQRRSQSRPQSRSEGLSLGSSTLGVGFSYIWNPTIAVTSSSLNLHPSSFGGPVATAADAYALYRFIKLEYRIQPTPSGTTIDTSVAYYPGVIDGSPATFVEMSANRTYTFLSRHATVATQWTKLNSRTLGGYLPWYKTVYGSLDPSEENQGLLYLIASAAGAAIVEIRGRIVFKNALNTTSTPMLLKARRDRERKYILELLSGSPAPAVSVQTLSASFSQLGLQGVPSSSLKN